MTAVLICGKRSHAWEALEAVADDLTPGEHRVARTLITAVFSGGPRQGAWEGWYSHVAKLTGYGVDFVGRAMRRLREVGLVAGRPEPVHPGPGGLLVRATAQYRIGVPTCARKVRSWMLYEARALLNRPAPTSRTKAFSSKRDVEKNGPWPPLDRPTRPPHANCSCSRCQECAESQVRGWAPP